MRHRNQGCLFRVDQTPGHVRGFSVRLPKSRHVNLTRSSPTPPAV